MNFLYNIPIYEIELPKNATSTVFYVRDGYFTYINDAKRPYNMLPGTLLLEPLELGTNNWKGVRYKEFDLVDKVIITLSVIRKEHYERFWQEMSQNMMTDTLSRLAFGLEPGWNIIVIKRDFGDDLMMECGLCYHIGITETRLV